MTVRLPAAVRRELIAHAREGTPPEVCGVLAGERGERGERGDSDDDGARVERAIRTPNAAATPRTAYEVPPERLHAVLTDVEAAGEDVVGFYHSHPDGPAEPSATDRAAATWTGHLYLIVAPDAPAVRAWRWTGERFAEVAVVPE